MIGTHVWGVSDLVNGDLLRRGTLRLAKLFRISLGKGADRPIYECLYWRGGPISWDTLKAECADPFLRALLRFRAALPAFVVLRHASGLLASNIELACVGAAQGLSICMTLFAQPSLRHEKPPLLLVHPSRAHNFLMFPPSVHTNREAVRNN